MNPRFLSLEKLQITKSRAQDSNETIQPMSRYGGTYFKTIRCFPEESIAPINVFWILMIEVAFPSTVKCHPWL